MRAYFRSRCELCVKFHYLFYCCARMMADRVVRAQSVLRILWAMQRATPGKQAGSSTLRLIQNTHSKDTSSVQEQEQLASLNRGRTGVRNQNNPGVVAPGAGPGKSAESKRSFSVSSNRSPSVGQKRSPSAAKPAREGTVLLKVLPAKWIPDKDKNTSLASNAVADLKASVASVLKEYAPSQSMFARWHDHVPSSSYLLYIWDKKAAKHTAPATQAPAPQQQQAPSQPASRKECVCVAAVDGSKELPGTGPNGHFFSVGSAQVSQTRIETSFGHAMN
jgi:hypothetical protein